MRGWLDNAISTVILLQQVIQARWYNDHPLLCLPHTNFGVINGIGRTLTIPQLQEELALDRLEGPPTEKQRKFYETMLMKRSALELNQAKDVCLLQFYY